MPTDLAPRPSRATSPARRSPRDAVSGAWHRAEAGIRAAWDGPRRAWGGAVGAAAGFGLLAGWWTPRGPTSALAALVTLALALLVGLVAGVLLRTRWAIVVAPAVFVAVLELARFGLDGPTVDGIHLGSTYGFLAFAVGRGLHGLLALLPMVLGAVLGASLARRMVGAPPSRPGALSILALWLRRAVALATGLLIFAVAALIAQPATTSPIVGADGEPLPGAVAELTRVDVNGHDLVLMLRGTSVENPVLLFLAGGPGGSEFGAMRRHSEALEDDFVVVTLDQRGTGKSYDQLDPTETMTPEQAVEDVLVVTDYLRDRFSQEKVYLVGQSWGSLLGVLAVQRQPDWFHAFVGVGQMVSPLATDRVFYRDTLDWARETGDSGLVDTLTRNGPPAYESLLDYEPALSYEQEVYPYDHGPNSEGAGQMGENINVEEYSFLDKAHIFAGFLDTFSVLYPQVQNIDFREQVTALEVPVYLAQGRFEAPGRAAPAQEWFDLLVAPRKELTVFQTSGHRPLWEQPDAFSRWMTQTVLRETEPTS